MWFCEILTIALEREISVKGIFIRLYFFNYFVLVHPVKCKFRIDLNIQSFISMFAEKVKAWKLLKTKMIRI